MLKITNGLLHDGRTCGRCKQYRFHLNTRFKKITHKDWKIPANLSVCLQFQQHASELERNDENMFFKIDRTKPMWMCCRNKSTVFWYLFWGEIKFRFQNGTWQNIRKTIKTRLLFVRLLCYSSWLDRIEELLLFNWEKTENEEGYCNHAEWKTNNYLQL